MAVDDPGYELRYSLGGAIGVRLYAEFFTVNFPPMRDTAPTQIGAILVGSAESRNSTLAPGQSISRCFWISSSRSYEVFGSSVIVPATYGAGTDARLNLGAVIPLPPSKKWTYPTTSTCSTPPPAASTCRSPSGTLLPG